MAEILLKSVLGKLAGFTIEKVLQLCGVNKAIENLESLSEITDEVDELKEELSSIQVLIEEADNRRIVDKTKKKWVMDLIEIAYDIEDALDIFLLECPTALSGIKKLPKVISKFPFLWNFQKKIKKIRKKISGINERGQTYNANNLGEVIPRQSISGQLDPIGDPQIVGFDEDIKNIVDNYLCDENIKRLAVVSIVGPGGLGKTTLAQKVRCSEKVKKEFAGEIAWVTISQKYDLLGVLRKIGTRFQVESTGLDMNDLAEQIKEHLRRKKYLIILDDVWTKELWDQLKEVMPDAENGSRILITTRLVVDVAKKADTLYEPYQPEFLNDDESRDLFLKKAIPRNLQRSEVEPNLKELPDKFIRKCKGLPLALLVLGSLLSTKPCNYDAWRDLLETMKWHDDGADCSKAIATSFKHLPYARKFCFMYFAAFPEDQEIKVKPLLRMWIAEGLIPQEESRTLEQTAERILEDLVQRSMVQVASRNNIDGSLKSLRVHDVLRDLAIKKAKKNNFLAVCSKQDDWNLEHCRKARRVAVHYSNFNESMQKFASPNLRSLLVFGPASILDCSKYRLLRVLAQISARNRKRVLEQSFTKLSHLRYLQLQPLIMIRELKNAATPVSDFGKWLETMKSLESLDCEGVPGGQTHLIWKIETLRHVSLSSRIQQVGGPPASANLPNLQTLNGVGTSPTWGISQLPNITELRELSIRVERNYPLDVIAALLGKLNHLVFLEMHSGDFQIQMFEGVFRFLEKLKQMIIQNEILRGESISALELKDNMLPPNLIRLELHGFEFKSDPMPVLEKLGNLKFLNISRSNREYPLKIKCSAGGFKQLEDLTLNNIELLQGWEIEIGAMPLLKQLRVSACLQLLVPQPKWFIDHKTLRYLNWAENSETTDLQEANENKLNEISNARPDLIVRIGLLY